MSGDALAAFQERIGHRFAKPELLQEAMTHSSAGHGRKGAMSNERLEFLGDRVLGLIVASELLARHPAHDEAALAQALNALVRKEACARAARNAQLGEALILSKSEDEAGGRRKEAILGDACEAVIAALYLDAGYGAAHAFVLKFWGEDTIAADYTLKDAKTALQEWAAAKKREAPRYTIVERSGPDHAPSFIVSVDLGDGDVARGHGASRREAEQNAAAALLKAIG